MVTLGRGVVLILARNDLSRWKRERGEREKKRFEGDREEKEGVLGYFGNPLPKKWLAL